MSPENLGTYTIELVVKRSKLSLSTECDIASTSSNILISEIFEISNNRVAMKSILLVWMIEYWKHMMSLTLSLT